MKRKFKCLLMSILALFSFSSFYNVKAATTTAQFNKTYIGTYHYVDSTGKFGDFEHFSRANDGKITYCIEPGVPLSYDVYQGYYGMSTEELASKVGLTRQQLYQSALVAHYGYGYADHVGNEWIVATQAMIWSITGRSFQFTSRNYSPNPWQYVIPTPTEIQAKMNEINRLISEYEMTPDFPTTRPTIILGQSYVLTDNDNIISNYQVESCENCQAIINGNQLIITPTSTEGGKINLIREDRTWQEDFIVYTHATGQDLLVPGVVDPIAININFEVISGSLSLTKYDSETKSCQAQDGGSLKGSVYKLYKENGEFVQDLVIDENCQAGATNLTLGKYYIQESKAGTNYELDNNKYYFDITEKNYHINLTVYDKPFYGEVEILKYDGLNHSCEPSGDATLVGALYGIYKKDGTLVQTMTIDSNCYASSGRKLLVGEYYVKEIQAPNGYQIDTQKYDFSITEENYKKTIRIEVEDIPFTTLLTINKMYLTDNGVEAEVGAKFDIYLKSTNEKVATLVIDESATASVTLPFGEYLIKQVDGKDDWELSEDINFSVNNETPNKSYITLLNKPYSSKLKVEKIDENGNKIKLAGIKFKIFDVMNNQYVCQTIAYPTLQTICEFETDENGEFITPLPLMPGRYRLEEIDQQNGNYLWNKQSQEFEIGKNTNTENIEGVGVVFTTKFMNKFVKGELIIYKTGEKVVYKDDGIEYEQIPLEGVVFEIYADEDIYENGLKIYSKGEMIQEIVTDAEGKATLKNLPLGKYYVKEIRTSSGHIINEEIHKFELTYVDQYTEIVYSELYINNEWSKGGLEISKIDISTGDPIANVKFEIFTEEGTKVYEAISDKNGKIIVENLPAGKYFFIESQTPEGYLANNKKMYFQIKENGEIIKATVENEPITGIVEITKKDISTGEVIPNTLLEIYNAENDMLVFSGWTDENGMIIIENLRYGTYYILEKEAAENYILNTEKMYFQIKENGEIVKATVENHKKEIKVPNTLSVDYLPIICGFTIIVGIIIYTVSKDKRKK